MKMFLRSLLSAVLLFSLLHLAGAQTLAEVLTAVQKRKQVIEERAKVAGKVLLDAKSMYDADMAGLIDVYPRMYVFTPDDMSGYQAVNDQPIDWIVWPGLSRFPADAEVEALGVSDRFQLLSQAWDELDELELEYYDARTMGGGIGVLKPVDSGKLSTPVPLQDYGYWLKKLAARAKSLSLAQDWPILWRDEGSGAKAKVPPPPVAPFTIDGANSQLYFYGYLLAGRHDTDYYAQESYDTLANIFGYTAFDPSGSVDGQDNSGWGRNWVDQNPYGEIYDGNSVPGKIHLYSDFKYFVTVIRGLKGPFNSLGDTLAEPGNQEWSATAASNSLMGLPGVSLFGGDGSVTYIGRWVAGVYDPQGGSTPYTFVPTYAGQPSNLLPDTTIPWGKNYVAGNFYDSTLDGPYGPQLGDGMDSNGLRTRSAFEANFGQNEFSGPTMPVPEEMPILQIVPRLDDGELVVRLANAPESDCELVWKFPTVVAVMQSGSPVGGELAARQVLTPRGCGKWDALYSGRTADREAQTSWTANYTTRYKRWANFAANATEYWTPVLTQLVTATCGIDVTQDTSGTYKYKVSVYRKDQIGTKSSTTGRYQFNGTPVETFTVENPSGDPDASPGTLKITTGGGAVYNLTVTQTSAYQAPETYVDSQWTLNATQNGTQFLSKNVAVTAQRVQYTYSGSKPSWSVSQPKKIVDQTTLDGVSLPQVTTTYWDLANRSSYYVFGRRSTKRRIDKIIEAGADGTRTTSYTYQWVSKDSTDQNDNPIGYSTIGHLTGIQQTGGNNPYSASYGGSELLTDWTSGSGELQVGFDGLIVTRTELFGGATVRASTSTYSDGLATVNTPMSGIGDAPAATTRFNPSNDGTNPWGAKLVRGFDGTLTTCSYAWSGSDFVTTVASGRESSTTPGTVAAGTQTVIKTNGAGQVWSTVVTDLESGLTLDFATATDYQGGNTPFPSTFSRPLGTTEQYAYDGQGRVTSHTDQLGIVQAFTLDALGRVTQSTRNGLTWNIAYNQNALGRTINTTDGNTTRTRTETTSPFGSNQTVAITGPEHVTTTRTEDANNITTTVQNSTTAQTTTETVQKGNLATTVGGNATEPWAITYNFPGGGWKKTVAHGNDAALTATTTYDALGRVAQEDTPSPTGSGTATTTHAYMGGRLTSATDPAGTTTYSYQPDGSLGQVSRGGRNVTVARAPADGSSLGWVWTDATGETLWQQNYYPASGVTKDYPWGESARAVTSTPTITGNVLSLGTSGPTGSGSAGWQDGVPSVGSWTSGAATTGWTAQGNAFGDMTSQSVKPGNATANALTTTFDALGLPTGTTGLVATTQANTFDGSGNFASVITRNGHPLTSNLSAKGDDLGTTGYGVPDAPWSTPSYGGTITRTLSTGAGNAQFTYNLAGALQRRQFPDGSGESFGYDASGALASRTTPRGLSFNFAPNAFSQPTQIGGLGTLGYDNAGRVNSVSNSSDTSSQTYTEGQLHTDSHTLGVLNGQTLEKDYDNLGHLKTVKLPGGVAISYSYNGPNGSLSGVGTAGGLSGTWSNFDAVTGRAQTFALGPLTTTSAWDGLGRPTSQVSTAHGSTWAYNFRQYDADGHCQSVNTPEGGWTYGFDGYGWLHTAQGWQSLTYNFDEVGRLAGNATDFRPTVRLNDSRVAIFGTVTPAATVLVLGTTLPTAGVAVSVDATSGAFSLTLGGVPSGWQTYTTRGTLAKAGTGGTDAVADAVNEVFVPPVSETLGYDASGNRSADARWTQTWDPLERMLSMVEANPWTPATAMTVAYQYDLQGRRVQKTVTLGAMSANPKVTKRTTTLWDGWRPVMEIDYTGSTGTESVRRYYTWGPDVSGTLDGAAGIGGLLEVLEMRGGTVSAVSLPISDGVGNVVGLVDGSTGVRVASYQYGPFGEVLGVSGARTSSCPLRFQTKLYDDETDLSYFLERYYDAKTQTWLGRDPLREAGGVNLYAYCGNDPVGNFDPIGLAEVFEAGLDANGIPQVHYWDWARWWGPLIGGETNTWWQAPNGAELARMFRQNTDGGWRLASESERHDAFWQQFNASLPGAMQQAGQSYDAFAKLNGGAFAVVSGVGLIAEGGLTLGTGILVGHEAWFAGSSWGSLATGNNYPVTPEGAILQASGASANAVNATDALVSVGVPFLAGRGPLLSSLGPEWNPLNYSVPAGELYSGVPRLVYRGPQGANSVAATIGHDTPWVQMSQAQRNAFKHSYMRHGAELGLPNWKESTAAVLQQQFNNTVGYIRQNGVQMYGPIYKPWNGQSVPVNFFEANFGGMRYYYYEDAASGQFISAGRAR